MGKTALATNIAYNIAKNFRSERQADGSDKVVDGAVVGFFSLEMWPSSSPPASCRSRPSSPRRSPRHDRRGRVRSARRASQQMSQIRSIDQTGGITIAQLAAARAS